MKGCALVRRAIYVSVVGLYAVTTLPALAQATPPPAVKSDADQVGDIVVTAQKRSEKASRVPMSITAVSGEGLREAGIRDITDLAKVVPGFHYTQSAYATPIYSIRGIGFNESSLGVKPTVGVYVDEVALPLAILTGGAALDIEQVEVLKGPQGTLFGGNTTGGAINYIAAKPTDHFTAGAELSFGRFDMFDGAAFISGPVTDTLKARAAVSTEQGGNWQRSYTRDAVRGQRNKTIRRVLLDWQPVDRLKLELNTNLSHDGGDTQAAQLIAETLQNGRSAPSAHVPLLDSYPSAPANARAADWDPDRAYRKDNNFFQEALRVHYQLSDEIALTSLSSYIRFNENQDQDPDGTALQNIEYTTLARIRSFNQELRLEGDSGPLKWIVGGNYEHISVHERDNGRVGYNNNVFIGGVPFTTYYNLSDETFATKAMFANGDYSLSDKFAAHGGLRYADTSIDFKGCTGDGGDGVFGALFGGVGPGQCVTYNATFTSQGIVTNALDQHNLSWRAGLDYKATGSTLIYANVSRGYKAGSFPVLSAFLATQFAPVVQESVTAYEAGVKATLADRSLQLTAAGFYYDYSNKQVRGRVPAPVFVSLEALVNIPKSRILGGEVQALWKPAKGVTLNLAGTYIDSRIEGNFTNYDPYSRLTNFEGQPFPLTSKWQGDADLAYDWALTDRIDGFAGVNIDYQGKTNGGLGELAILAIPGYTLVDLRAGVRSHDDAWRLSLWARNVADKYYWTAANHISDTTVKFAGLPRTFGATLSFRVK